MRNKSFFLTGAVFVCALGLAMLLNSCDSQCDGKKCKEKLGFADKTYSIRDSLFRAKNPFHAKKFDVYVESSVSMDGYVIGHTTFKTTLHRLIGQVVADVLADDKSITLSYINSVVDTQSVKKEKFTDFLAPASFARTAGDRANSNIIEAISNVVQRTQKGNVSMFVSDCVYSPESAIDIDKALKKQQTDMLNILKNKAKSDETFGVLLYRLVSDFHGIYYTKTNAHIDCDGPRPYFVWFFGDESILANVRKSISKIMTEEKADYIVGIPGYEYVPYKAKKSDHGYHYLNAKTNADSVFSFGFCADLSTLPLTEEYVKNKDNYTCAKSKYSIKKIDVCSDENSCDYEYHIAVRGRKNAPVTPVMVEISLNSMLKTLPKWVNDYDDPTGEDYDRGYDPKKLRTFGLKSLVEGVADYYNKPYVTFRILIN